MSTHWVPWTWQGTQVSQASLSSFKSHPSHTSKIKIIFSYIRRKIPSPPTELPENECSYLCSIGGAGLHETSASGGVEGSLGPELQWETVLCPSRDRLLLLRSSIHKKSGKVQTPRPWDPLSRFSLDLHTRAHYSKLCRVKGRWPFPSQPSCTVGRAASSVRCELTALLSSLLAPPTLSPPPSGLTEPFTSTL